MPGAAACGAITQLVYRCARAIDRLDEPLLRSCFHPGARDVRPGLFEGSAEDYVTWVMPVLAGMQSTRHAIANVLVMLGDDGASAGVESYFTATLRMVEDGQVIETVRSGRYLDAVSYKDGAWRIDRRETLIDLSRRASLCPEDISTRLDGAGGGIAGDGSRDRGDPSYAVLRGAYSAAKAKPVGRR